MAQLRFQVAVLMLAAAGAGALRTAPAKAKEATAADVQALHKKLDVMCTGLEGMVGKDGSLSHTKVNPELQLFAKHLRATLASTAGMKDYAKAMKELMDARAGVAILTKSLINQQTDLMKDDESQKESLLLGILMTHQKESMDAQLKVLASDDFKGLAVTKELLAKHESKTALYAQVADYLDKHGGKGVKVQNAQAIKDAAANVEAIASNLHKKVEALENAEHDRQRHHQKSMAVLEADLKKAADKHEKHKLEALIKHEKKQYDKAYKRNHRDVVNMQAAETAVRNGDMKALNKARAALEESMKEMQSKGGNFLHFIQLSHRTFRRDCPFCAAQCVDKCHTAGKPYVQCLTDCADAGKGF